MTPRIKKNLILGGVLALGGPALGTLFTGLGMMLWIHALGASGVVHPSQLSHAIGLVLIIEGIGLAIGLVGLIILIVSLILWLVSRKATLTTGA